MSKGRNMSDSIDAGVQGERLDKALELTTSVMSTKDLDQLLRKIVDSVTDEFGFEGCDAFILDKQKDAFVLKTTKGYSSEASAEVLGITKSKEALANDLSLCKRLGRFTYFLKSEPGTDTDLYYRLLHPDRAAKPRVHDDDWHELDVMYVAFEDANGNMAGFLEPDGPRSGKIPSGMTITNLEIFAALASIAIANSELVMEMERNVKAYKTLIEATSALQEPVDLADTLQKIAEKLNKLVPFEEISVYLVDWERNLLTPIYATGPYTDEVMSDIGPITGLAGEVAKTGKVDIVEDSMDDQRVEDIPGIEEDEVRQTVMAIPLKGKSGEVVGVLELYRDKSRKYTEVESEIVEPFATHAAIALENAQMREELKRNFESVQKAYEDMRQLDKAKDNLVNTISHELRTPLTTILGYLEMASEGMYGDIPPKLREKFGAMVSSVNRINILVSKMLEMSRLQDDMLMLDLESINLAMVTKEVVKELEGEIQKKNHTVNVLFGNELPIVQADRLRMHDVIQTLLSNAIKYTNPGGKITVGADLLSGKVHIWVKDTGVGISSDERTRMFDRFYMADAGLTREDGRVGIGLYVSREIVRKHGGDVWFESRKNEGSTFHFTVPLKQKQTK